MDLLNSPDDEVALPWLEKGEGALRLLAGQHVKSTGADRNRAAHFRIQALFEFCPLSPQAPQARDS